MNIQELMSKPAVTCRHDDTLDTAAQLMWEHDCGVIPVVGEDGQLVGMLTDRDICMATYTRGSPPRAIRVADAMAKKVFSCRATDPLETVERLMGDKQVRRVPIVDGHNRPIGVLSVNDLARYAATLKKKNGAEREVVQMLAAICQPRQTAQPSATRQTAQPSATR